MIYTGYFAKIPKGIECASICRYPPSWWKGRQIKELAPSEQIFKLYKNGVIDKELFSKLYLNQIKDINIKELVGEKDICLLCWEPPGEFCHRHLLGFEEIKV